MQAIFKFLTLVGFTSQQFGTEKQKAIDRLGKR